MNAATKFKKMFAPWRKSFDKTRQYIKKQRHYFVDNSPYSKSYDFSGSHGSESWTRECWAPKNWCFWNVVLEKALENPSDCKEIKPSQPKGNQSWIFIGGTDAEAEVLILWPPDVKSLLIRKDSDAGKDWRQEKGMVEDEMVAQHLWLNVLEFEQALGDDEGQGNLVCCSPVHGL